MEEWPDMIGEEEWPDVIDDGLAESKPKVDREPLLVPNALAPMVAIYGLGCHVWRRCFGFEPPAYIANRLWRMSEEIVARHIWSRKLLLPPGAWWPPCPPERQLTA